MKRKFNLILWGMVAATSILSWSCSTQKQNNEADHADSLNGSGVNDTEHTETSIEVFDGVNAGVKAQINVFLTDYYAINQMLIVDNHEGAKVAAKKLGEAVKKFDMTKLTPGQMDFYLTQVSRLNLGLKGIVESTDMMKAREELATLSVGMHALVKAFHPNTSAIYYQFCPMARDGHGANWLSGTKEIANPYMGQMMPECGRTEETLY